MGNRVWARPRGIARVLMVSVLLMAFFIMGTGVASAAGRQGVEVTKTWYGHKVTIYVDSDTCYKLATGAGAAGVALQFAEPIAKALGPTPPGIIVNLIMPLIKAALAGNALVLSVGAKKKGMYFTLLFFEAGGRIIYVNPGVSWYQ